MGDSPESIANAFVQHYYSTLSSNPSQMGSLYQDGSNLIWEYHSSEKTTSYTNDNKYTDIKTYIYRPLIPMVHRKIKKNKH